jgi:hypothetical protein
MFRKLTSFIKAIQSNRFLIFWCLGLFLVYYFLHASFLLADADLQMGSSRGAWTDEGLNTSQLRNFINHGAFDLIECDNFLKTPFFSLILLIPFKLFGTGLLTARLTVLVISFVPILLLVFKTKNCYEPIFFMLGIMLFFPIFQYAHLAVPEMCSISLIVIAGLIYSYNKGKYTIGITCLFLLLSVLCKIQFVYILFIPLLVLLLTKVLKSKNNTPNYSIKKISTYLGFSLILLIAWFLFFKNEFEFISSMQSGSFSLEKLSIKHFAGNCINYFLSKYNFIYTLAFIASLIIGLKGLKKNQYQPTTTKILLFAFTWFLLELHKLPMVYLPIRYMISMYLVMGLIITIVCSQALLSNNGFIKNTSFLIFICLFIFNLYTYYQGWNNRTFNIYNTNKYLSNFNLTNKSIIGPWSPSLTWYSKSKTYPVWHTFYKTKSPIKKYAPAIVISERNEDDSNQAYQYLNIDLNAISDSVKTVQIASWKVNIYWLRQQSAELKQ